MNFLLQLFQNLLRGTETVLMYLLNIVTLHDVIYEGQSKITEPYLITFESSKLDKNLDDISL